MKTLEEHLQARHTELLARCLRLEQEKIELSEHIEALRALVRTQRAALRSREELAAEWARERRWLEMAHIL